MSTPEKRKIDTVVSVTTERRRSSRRPKKKVKLVPTLRAGFTGGVTEDACGGFQRKRQWTVDNPEQGLIIQHVTRAFTGVRQWMSGTSSWAAMTNGQIDAYVTEEEPYATVTEYWEAWQVNDRGRVTDNEDSFALCSIIPDGQHVINTTQGTFTISGEAQFYQTTDDADTLGFTGAVGPAGVIANRDTDPAGDLATNGATASGAVVGYEIVATWNSRYTGIVPPGFGTDGSGDPPYFADTVYTTVTQNEF